MADKSLDNNRPTWNEYFMAHAELASTRSICLRAKVGAVAVRDHRVLATGYNGPPVGVAHCTPPESGKSPSKTTCLRAQGNIPSGTRHELCRGVHAELNVIISAAREGVSLWGSALYCTHQPCIICMKALANVGVSRVFYKKPYPDPRSLEIAKDAHISIYQLAQIPVHITIN